MIQILWKRQHTDFRRAIVVALLGAAALFSSAGCSIFSVADQSALGDGFGRGVPVVVDLSNPQTLRDVAARNGFPVERFMDAHEREAAQSLCDGLYPDSAVVVAYGMIDSRPACFSVATARPTWDDKAMLDRVVCAPVGLELVRLDGHTAVVCQRPDDLTVIRGRGR